MTTATLLTELRRRDIRLVAEGERLRALGPKGALTPDLQEALAANKIEILATANLFRAGHRICLEITSADRPTGVAGATNVEYVPYHVCSSRTTLHHVHHDTRHPSHLLLPVIPGGATA